MHPAGHLALLEQKVGALDQALPLQGWDLLTEFAALRRLLEARVSTSTTLTWHIDWKSSGIDRILPNIRTDIVLDHPETSCRIVVDTKFTSVLTSGWYREESLRSGYLYQIYAYLQSQVGHGDPLTDGAEGLLLHPSVGENVDETVVIQGHHIRFMTVDLTASTSAIREGLLSVISSTSYFHG